MNEDAVMRKLVADGDGTGDDRRIVQLFQLINMLGKSNADTKNVSNKILTILDQIELSFNKQQQVALATEAEMANCDKLHGEIDGLIAKNVEKMEKVKKELAEAKQIRKNRQEYDALAKLIKEKPSRAETSKKLKALQDELEEAYSKQKTLEQRLIEKRKSMYTLAVLLDNLDELNKEPDGQIQMSEMDEASPAPPPRPNSSNGPEKAATAKNELELDSQI